MNKYYKQQIKKHKEEIEALKKQKADAIQKISLEILNKEQKILHLKSLLS